MEKVFIVVAAGAGLRMKYSIPKQFILVNNYPILYYTIKNINSITPEAKIIVVINEKFINLWNELCVNHNINIPHTLVAGGPERFHSVKNALNSINDFNPETIVAIHDGVRPFVSKSIIENGFMVASRKGSAVPVTPVYDSLREVSGALSKVVPRHKYCLIQTPQFFKLQFILDAYKISWSETFTDDAIVYETTGRQITLIEGDKDNFKITNNADLKIAQALLSNISE